MLVIILICYVLLQIAIILYRGMMLYFGYSRDTILNWINTRKYLIGKIAGVLLVTIVAPSEWLFVLFQRKEE